MSVALLLLSDEDCALCGEPVGIFIRIDGQPSCARCWRRRGSPFPRREATAAELLAAEIATRERMQKRGGADRHLVRAGKS